MAVDAKKPARSKRTREREGSAISREEFLALKKPKGNLILEIDGEHVSLTHIDRVYWPTEKITKFDLLCYYLQLAPHILPLDRKSTRLNSSHRCISYAVFCL